MGCFNILKKRRDFRKTYAGGKVVADGHLVIYYKANNLGISRFGFSVSKKVGCAVKRNKVRRILKEICRKNQEKFLNGRDYVIVSRPGIVGKSYQKVSEILLSNLRRLG
ncbi:MAG: ribonuclease P protein component [Peptococcaceae bacterium]|jgi:ribonuclease P protein component|nr:MAG: ribonuclease P protein component [Peptococcaceae bacterium]